MKNTFIFFLIISLLFSLSASLTGVYASDDDFDNDGVDNDYPDNCVFTYNPNQLNTDGDRLGDVCDPNNYAPYISDIVRNSKTVTVGEEFVMEIYVNLGENDNPSNVVPYENLVIDVVNKPNGAIVSRQLSDGNSYIAVMRWTPSQDDVGEHRFLIQVEDGDYNAIGGTARGHEGQLHTNYRPQDYDGVFIIATMPEEASVVVEEGKGIYGYIKYFVDYVFFFLPNDDEDELPENDEEDPTNEEDEPEDDLEYIPEDDGNNEWTPDRGGRLEREEDILIDGSSADPVYEDIEDSEESKSKIKWYKFNMINSDKLKSGNDAYVLISFANTGEENLDYAKITVTVSELSIYRDYMFNKIKADEIASAIAVLPVPKTAKSGEYTVKAQITGYSDSERINKVRYRTFTIIN